MQEPGLKNLDEISNTRVEWGKSFSDLFFEEMPFSSTKWVEDFNQIQFK